MDLHTTIALMIAAGLLTGLCNLLHRRPTEVGRVRLVPYLGLQFLGILIMILLAGHLVTLLTGKPFGGRLSP